MSRFLTDLDVVLLSDKANGGRGRWQLHNDLVYDSDVTGHVIVVPTGFVTDFASVPRLPLVFELVGDMAHGAAVVHDWLYTTCKGTREEADAVLREAATASGVPAYKAQMMWLGVRMFGASHWGRQ